MMDVADGAGVQLTFFLDVLEETLYPGEIREVLRTIHARGHDIQLHQHAYLIPDETWSEWQNDPLWHSHEADSLDKIDCWDEETADFLFEQMISIFEEENIPLPVASRGGSYAYNQAILDSMMKHNITTSYNYEPQMRPDYFNTGIQPMFNWSNGVVEGRMLQGDFDVGCGCNGIVPWGTCSDAQGWFVISSPDEGLNAAADINFDSRVNAEDLGIMLAAWGDAPRNDYPPSDCPLGLIP